MDADVVLSLGLREARNLGNALTAAGFQAELSPGDMEDPIAGLLRVIDRFGNRVDLLTGLKGLDPQAFSRAIDVPFQGRTLKFIGREDFIAMKAFAGGPMDLVDAARAIAASGDSLDFNLVRRLAKRFGRQALESLDRLQAG
ncbi:MAG: hypothetical protein JSR67_00820 [Proteobacteria bacterium]|nr:hypothetical protein [Pseudomonadota bacterium]